MKRELKGFVCPPEQLRAELGNSSIPYEEGTERLLVYTGVVTTTDGVTAAFPMKRELKV